ncbi:MAG: YmdB family metallophosphoesterase [Clostridiales bacterium]|nr:YmdB family metallophosphoesterase [Clostridiales bacterium]
MRILCIGDIVGPAGTAFVERRLWGIRKLLGADFVIANGENASAGNGLLPADARRLLDSGVDVITGGNHIWRRREIYALLEEESALLRPHNYPEAPGTGQGIYATAQGRIEVVSLIGQTYMDPIGCPFRTADRLLAAEGSRLCVVDFHAEATSEKRALAEYLDGRVTAVVGTHTHVQTADEQILKGGTAFITDLGMTGPTDSVLGVASEEVIERFLTGLPVRFRPGEGPVALCGALIEADPETGRACSIERVCLQ